MHNIKALIFLTACITLSACAGKPAEAPAPSAVTVRTAAPSPANGDYPGRGKVTKIDMKLGSVELDHEEIKGVMPAMKMEFFVSDKKILGGLTVGDQVDFTLRYNDNTEIIVDIKKVQ